MTANGSPESGDGCISVVHLRLSTDGSQLLGAVFDPVPEGPAVATAGPEDESGRGLELVAALSSQWAWARVDGWLGKVVWAKVTAP